MAVPLFRLDNAELAALVQLYDKCATQPSSAIVQTWCTGDGRCGANVTTHPCTGRLLEESNATTLAALPHRSPWFGITCDPRTDPVSVLEVALPYQALVCTTLDLDFSAFARLKLVNLEGNAISGPVPTWVPLLPDLEVLNLNFNNLSGNVPGAIADAPKLQELSLAGNALRGPLPRGLEVPPLELLDVGNNNLHGPLPTALLHSATLRYLDVSGNALDGPIPTAQLPRLEHFDVAFNQLSGPLPLSLSTWGRHDNSSISMLTYFDASNNSLSTRLPSDLGDLDLLEHFSVTNNSHVYGRLPRLPPLLTTDAVARGANLSCPLPDLPGHDWGATRCVCGDGSTVMADGTCALCPSGTYSSNALLDKACAVCDVGTFSLQGADTCAPCAAGTFANTSGASACTMCALGSVSATGASECHVCAPGTTSTLTADGCVPCPPGTFSSDGGMCEPCPAGAVAAASGATQCTLCPSSTFAPAGSASCLPCATGFVADGSGNAECFAQPPSGWGWKNRTTTAPCTAGTFNNGSFVACQACAFGTAVAVDQATACERCVVGTYAPRRGSTACIPAPVGTCVPSTGARRPDPCAPGTFADRSGQAACTICPGNTTSTLPGAVRCSAPSAGHILENTSWPQLLLTVPVHASFLDGANTHMLESIVARAWTYLELQCTPVVLSVFENEFAPRGTQYAGNHSVSVRILLTSCLPRLTPDVVLDKIAMPIGSGQLAWILRLLWQPHGWPDVLPSIDLLRFFDSMQPAPCPVGTFWAHGDCHRCPAGSFAATPGALGCTLCSVNTVAATPGSSVCAACLKHTHAAIPGSLQCDDCPLFALTLDPQCRASLDALIFYACVCLWLLVAAYRSCRRHLDGVSPEPEMLLVAYRTKNKQTVNTVQYPLPRVISRRSLQNRRMPTPSIQ
ncbi:hypothetical protein SPRG_08575 [Saprolegnia parasitica CBS 223.65]|uniref:Tyrosine-protein kinase ephrin type A/B receptor-like domain-containing protein n=1 Tax=Saprolegnia parasitica (strain CBS 223.65) TaxID=695850 RepID=A0A067C6W3_SAPPC|nr:hypothetical protein SPRG_08575 [Saprolegnia parasitica CBS 223.65]KDO26213.1 hypothetical protein SPRG_08575 [Saprolegnia parasitica CBS 223.65]|eukprot:XP_012203205.1 hypothetical protein SPRG_08575 [Saprolegnia parasitica CBS 223.65]